MKKLLRFFAAAWSASSVAFQLFFVSALLAKDAHLFDSVSDSSTITLAVLDFKNNSGLFTLDALEKSIPEMLKTELSRSPSRLLVVERQKLEKILQEQALGQTGVLDEKTAQQVGQLVGAEFLVSGEISTVGPRLRIDCHIFKVATGQVRAEKAIGPGRETTDDMVRLLAANIIFNLTGEGDYREKLQLKKYPASWLLFATALSAAATGVTHEISHHAYQDYQSAKRLHEFDTYYKRASNFRKARNGLIIATGALALASINFWIKNRSEENQIFATTALQPAKPAGELELFAQSGEVRLGLRWRF
ncbi:MAG: CsgG/HfaB family protein [candidate division KSB1 bacterium]|nr:CsgG/HfaB family protein [candidate division KSB1 bacterium]MDZ7301082.1 CsgG/HfaB family protein [candidate division KSB1 bacterium]MDZ7312094.1 CsgG/HfaB family protein [candidate division KSB1 bacterium]